MSETNIYAVWLWLTVKGMCVIGSIAYEYHMQLIICLYFWGNKKKITLYIL